MGVTKPLSQLSAGQRLGPYTIQRLIGRGRQTEVYQASRTGAPDDVALKVFLPGVIRGPTHASCFNDEAVRIAALVHPNVARVYDFGCDTGKELCYLAVERIEGTTLRDSIATHPSGYPRDELCRLFEPIAEAIAAAHDQGVVHGSLRPDHILLRADARPVVADFSMTCLAEGVPASQNVPTGVVTYWAPEQAAQLVPSPAMDIYALGILLYELAVGDVPFKGSTRDAIVAQHLYNAPTPPSLRQPGLDPRIERAILIALRKNPAERFLSVREMLVMLNSADADDYATLTLDKRLAREVRRRSDVNAFRTIRSEPPIPEPVPAIPPAKRGSLVRWWIVAIVVLVAVLAFAVLL